MTDAAAKPRIRARLYRFRNALKEKASGGSAGPNSGGGSIALEALAKAEAEFEKMAEDYPDWVQDYIRRLRSHQNRCIDTPEQRHNIFKKLREEAHDLKGQGGTFGYPLISRFGESLYDVTAPGEAYPDNVVEVVKSHIDAMNAVIKGRISGDGGEVGQQLIDTLQEAIERFSRGESEDSGEENAA
jgi:HPt (histidine-containing phosphotransfer) domain-containing protein